MFRRIKHLIGRRLSPPPKALPPYDVLVFPVIEWRDRLQRPQQLSREFARRGHRVFYFSAELMPGFCACDTGWEQVEPNIFLVKVPGSLDPPRIYEDVPDAFQLAAMENGLRKMLDRFTLRSALAIVDYPFWAPLARLLAGCVVLYDCMDDYASFGNAGRPALELEAGLARDADLVVCSSTHLQKHIAGFGKESVLVRNGADVEHFAPRRADLTIHSNGSTAGFWGAIAEWTDIELLTCAARALPHVQFVLIGEVMRTDVSELASLPNVEFIGEAPYERLPAYLHSFDVCLLPYRLCDYTLASDPVKVWEYLSAGKPVVAVKYPEIERLSGLVTLTSTPEEFIEGIRGSLAGPDPVASQARRAFAQENTWSRRCDEIVRAAEPFFPSVSVIVVTHNQRTFTEACLNSLEEFSRYPNLEVVVVDNGSSDGSPEALDRWAGARSYAKSLRNPLNRGFAAASNQGARIASGDYLVFLNNDCFVTNGWIAGLLRHFRSDPHLGLLCPVTNSTGNESDIQIDYADMEEMAVEAWRYTRKHRGERIPLAVAHFFCVMIPRRVWQQVGELDESFGIGLFEDDDYSMRVRAAGFNVGCAEDVFVHHHHSATIGQLPRDEYDALFERNRRYFESKWGPWTAPSGRSTA